MRPLDGRKPARIWRTSTPGLRTRPPEEKTRAPLVHLPPLDGVDPKHATATVPHGQGSPAVNVPKNSAEHAIRLRVEPRRPMTR